MVKQVNVLGTIYKISLKSYFDPTLCNKELMGYCDMFNKEIVICDLTTYPGCEDQDSETINLSYKETLRHEILHAFLNESGLDSSSYSSQAWAMNEEMIDWFALQSPKIFKAYQDCKVI